MCTVPLRPFPPCPCQPAPPLGLRTARQQSLHAPAPSAGSSRKHHARLGAGVSLLMCLRCWLLVSVCAVGFWLPWCSPCTCGPTLGCKLVNFLQNMPGLIQLWLSGALPTAKRSAATAHIATSASTAAAILQHTPYQHTPTCTPHLLQYRQQLLVPVHDHCVPRLVHWVVAAPHLQFEHRAQAQQQ